MELGNMIFGHSRGQAQIPRDDPWEKPLFDLLEACGCDGYGWPAFENAVFKVQGYDWDAECDCGFDEAAEQWHEDHRHSPDCYDSVAAKVMAEYDSRTGYKDIEARAYGDDGSLMRGFDQDHSQPLPGVTVTSFTPRKDAAMKALDTARKVRDKYERDALKRLCAERGLTYPDGCKVHCDCYKQKAAQEWFGANDHKPECRVIQPNFLHKPTGFRIQWYKYPALGSKHRSGPIPPVA